MLRNFDIVTEAPDPVVDLYFKQCSVSVHCRDLAVMAATLANRGVNPFTGKQAIRGEYVESVLSVMGSCGMYDYAGEWIYTIGMPAKSGVAGGIIAVLPGQLGIGVFSPPLDNRGNSVRGIRVCDALSRHCDLHLFNRPSVGNSTIRLKFSAAQFNSHRVRTAEESRILQQLGERIKIYQLQGNLTFATAEAVVSDVMGNSMEYLIFDLKRVLTINESACRLFYELLNKLSDLGKHVLFTHAERLPLLRQFMKVKLAARYQELFRSLEDNDIALEWCESHIIGTSLPAGDAENAATRDHYELFEQFTKEELAIIVPLLRRRNCR